MTCTVRAREQTAPCASDPMLSIGSCGTLMSYTDHSVQRRLKSNAPNLTVTQIGAARPEHTSADTT